MKRLLVLLCFAVASAAVGVWAQTGYVSPDEEIPGPPVEQPIPYSHALHVGKLDLKCDLCHQVDEDGFLMSYPAEKTCMTCHSAIKTDSPHIQKLAEYAEKGESVPWEQIYRVPPYVWFAHASHADIEGVNCQTCHGPVQTREVLFKEVPTNMMHCMDCHAEHGAPNSCDFCHAPG